MGKFADTIKNPYFVEGLDTAISLASQWGSMLQEPKSINTNVAPVPNVQGKPVYTLGSALDYINRINPRGAGAREILTAGLQGFQALAPTGNPLLAGLAALTSAAGTAFFGGVRKRRMQRRKDEAYQNFLGQQIAYNKQVENYNKYLAAQDTYNDLLDTTNRMQILYS